MRQGETCEAALSLITWDRNEAYGPPEVDYQRTVDVFNRLAGRDLSLCEGVLFMICVKLSREAHLHKSDNLIDLCGYADILNRLKEEGHE